MTEIYYNLPVRSTEMAPGPTDKIFPPNFLVAALYVLAGSLLGTMGYSRAGTAMKLLGMIPAYRAWESKNFGGDIGKGI